MIHIPSISKEVDECKQVSTTSLVRTNENHQNQKDGNTEKELVKPPKKERRLRNIHRILSNHKANIIKIQPGLWKVRSQSNPKNLYDVEKNSEDLFQCSCDDFKYSYSPEANYECKHIEAIKAESLTENNSKISIEEIAQKLSDPFYSFHYPIECKACNSKHCIRFGTELVKRNGEIRKQKYQCSDCKYVFTNHEKGYENMMYEPKIVREALNLIASGVSYRKSASHLILTYHKEITHPALLYWVVKYTNRMKFYTNLQKLPVSDTVNVDEMFVKIKDHNPENKDREVIVWNAYDNKTKYWPVTHVSNGRKVEDAREMFRKLKALTKTTPKKIMTDSYPVYPLAIRKEFPISTSHIRYLSLAHNPNNNGIENLHSQMRLIIMNHRHLQNAKTVQVLFDLLRIIYNFVHIHPSLDNKTPAEAAGYTEDLGPDKLEGLIRKSSEKYNELLKFKIPLKRKRLLHRVRCHEESDSIIVIPKFHEIGKSWLDVNQILIQYGFEWKSAGKNYWIKPIDSEQNGSEGNHD